MTARCVTCAHFTLKGQPPEWARAGAYRCARGPAWEFRDPFSIRECRKHAQVAPEDLPARLAFEQKAKEKA